MLDKRIVTPEPAPYAGVRMLTATQASTVSRRRGGIFLAVVLLGAILVAVAAFNDNRPAVPAVSEQVSAPSPAPVIGNAADEAQVRAFVTEFGAKLALVPTSADQKTFQTAVVKEYGDFVAPSLLEYWKQNPDRAPGKATSSPAPSGIEITSVSADDADTYEVIGYVVETTNAADDPAIMEPMMAVVKRISGKWTIVSFEQSDL